MTLQCIVYCILSMTVIFNMTKNKDGPFAFPGASLFVLEGGVSFGRGGDELCSEVVEQTSFFSVALGERDLVYLLPTQGLLSRLKPSHKLHDAVTCSQTKTDQSMNRIQGLTGFQRDRHSCSYKGSDHVSYPPPQSGRGGNL